MCILRSTLRLRLQPPGLDERATFVIPTLFEPQGVVAVAQSILNLCTLIFYDICKVAKVVVESFLGRLSIPDLALAVSNFNPHLNMYYAGALSLAAAALIPSASPFSPSDPPTLPPTLTPLFTLTTIAGDIQAPIPRLLGGYLAGKAAYAHLQLF